MSKKTEPKWLYGLSPTVLSEFVRRFTTDELASKYLGVKPQKLRHWRRGGKAPGAKMQRSMRRIIDASTSRRQIRTPEEVEVTPIKRRQKKPKPASIPAPRPPRKRSGKPGTWDGPPLLKKAKTSKPKRKKTAAKRPRRVPVNPATPETVRLTSMLVCDLLSVAKVEKNELPAFVRAIHGIVRES
jgi:hypothetical protein